VPGKGRSPEPGDVMCKSLRCCMGVDVYVPQVYQAGSSNQISAVVSRYPLSLLVTNGASLPFATHLPVVPAADGCPQDLVGHTLLGHMNKMNPHWESLLTGTLGKLVFSGPGTYISPAFYETDPAAPTWDFVTVHLQGVIQPIVGREETLAVTRRTAAILEESFGCGWDQKSSVDYFRSIVGDVGAFEFKVGAAEAMFKLSQEKPPRIQQRLINEFTGNPPGSPSWQIGSFMSDLGLGVADGK
jgi:transcriptional regulator